MGTDAPHIVDRNLPPGQEWRAVTVLQALFLSIALIGLNAPFVSMHFVRQNQTYDVARHVFHEGWSAVLTPRASFTQLSQPDELFSPLVTPAPRFTIIHLEAPFHGVIGWPAAMMFPQHERAVVRLVSVLFALLSIRWIYLVLRHWLAPNFALIGAALWTVTPLVVHFGQVPMPDILATAGMAAAFLFALRGWTAASSVAFLFMILAKMSILIYGLPVLTALLLARDCRSAGAFFKISLAWGLLPLAGLAVWLSLSRHDPPGSWVVFGGYRPGNYGSISLHNFLQPEFYIMPLTSLLPFGCGILGVLGLLFALSGPSRMNGWLKGSILLALVANYTCEGIVWREPQYSLPVLFWLTIAASFGFPRLQELWRRDNRWKMAIGIAVLAHVVVVTGSIVFLKASRMPNLPDIEIAGRMTPIDSRVVVYAATPSASPAAWIDRNTLQLKPLEDDSAAMKWTSLAQQLKDIHQAGFDYLLLFDVEEPHRLNPGADVTPIYATQYTKADSPTRRFLDVRYAKIFEGNHVVLYRMSGE